MREFGENEIGPIAREHDEERKYPTDLVGKAADLDFIAPGISREYGGAGMDTLSSILITEELGAEGVEAKLDFAFAEGLYGDDPDPEFVEGLKAPWDSAEARVSLSRNAVATNTNHTTEIDYAAITAETLLLWGDDVLQPVTYGERLAEDLQDAQLSRLSEAFHGSSRTAPRHTATDSPRSSLKGNPD